MDGDGGIKVGGDCEIKADCYGKIKAGGDSGIKVNGNGEW